MIIFARFEGAAHRNICSKFAPMSETVLLTGADGLLGSNTTRELLRRGYKVKAMVEYGKTPETLMGLEGVTLCYGDLLNTESVVAAMQGTTLVIHCAANTNVMPARSEIIRRVNIEGTQHVIQAALQLGIRRLVAVSSAVSFGYGTKEQPGDETQPYKSAFIGLDYMDSKYQAHCDVLDAVKNQNLPAVLVCPTFMLGPFDSKPSSGAMLVALYKGKIPGYTSGGRNYIHVKDAAIGVVNALEKGQIGEAYILGNKNMDYKEAFALMCNELGVQPPRLYLPSFAVKALGLWGTFLIDTFGKTPALNYGMALNSCIGFYFDVSKSIRDLDLPQTPIEIAVKDSFEWLQQNGKV
jgi:dihydroflavonol-4-reductase